MLICLVHVAVDGEDTRTFYRAECEVQAFEELREEFRKEYAERLASATLPKATKDEPEPEPSPIGNEAVLALLGFLRQHQIRMDHW